MVEFTCDYCAKKFFVSSAKHRNGKHKFCNKQCSAEFLKLSLIGENNPNYKHGKHVDPKCECGNSKDYRAEKCAICANRGVSIGWDGQRQADIDEAIKRSRSVAEVSRLLGCTRPTIAKYIERHQIDVSHMIRTGKTKGWRAKGDRFQADAEEFLVKRYTGNRSALPRRIILRDNLLPYTCSDCGQEPMWNNKELTLELDHINGDKLDDRLDNLRFLCPNCHSQTPTFKGKACKGTPKGVTGKEYNEF